MTNLIHIINSSVLLNKEIIFDNFNFTLKKGEHLAITGDDFSGKSVLLKVLAGKQILSKGSIERPFFNSFIRSHKVDYRCSSFL